MSDKKINNEQTKSDKKCQCTKKIVVLDKEIKELKSKLEKQSREIEIIKKSLKR